MMKMIYFHLFQVQMWATNMEHLCKATPTEMVAVRALLYKYWGALGLKRDVLMDKDTFINGVSKLGKEDLKRKKTGTPTLLGELNEAWYDVIDQDNDGTLTLEELEAVMEATSMDKAGAKEWMKHLDKDNSGGIDKAEYMRAEHNFWYRSKKRGTSTSGPKK